MYTDQVPENDLSRGLAEKHGFTIYPTIKDAMTLGATTSRWTPFASSANTVTIPGTNAASTSIRGTS